MTFKDLKGYTTLDAISKADLFNQWMYEMIKPFVTGNILEIGSGIGNISQFFVQENVQITLSDVDDDYVNALRETFSHYPNVQDFVNINLQDSRFENTYAALREKFDTIFYLNVLEHLKDEDLAIQHSLYMLKPGGKLIILVPAYSFLYSKMDKALHHYRRYTQKSLNHLLTMNGMTVIKSFYFNVAGIFAWLYGKIVGLEVVPVKEMKSFNKMVPVIKVFDKVVFRKIGLSVISVALKN